MSQIEIKGLTVTYVDKKKNETVAIENLDATFPSGKFCAVTGLSGSGKSTLLKAIGGLFEFDGQIFIDGIDADTIQTKNRNFSYVSQDFVLYPSITVFDNIAMPLKVARIPKEEIVSSVNLIAGQLGLVDCLTRLPKHLSGGQQQRVALARALVKHPNVCLFDEPLSNIAPSERKNARNYIKLLTTLYGCTSIYVTHDISDVRELAEVVYVIADKKIVFSGSVAEFLESKDPRVIAVKGMDKGGFANED